jgi:hypothetical protein
MRKVGQLILAALNELGVTDVRCQVSHVECQVYLTRLPTLVSGSVGQMRLIFDMGQLTFDN